MGSPPRISSNCWSRRGLSTPGEEQENAEREHKFEADRDQQGALFSQAQEQTKALEATSHQLSAQYDANDKQINELEAQLKDRSGNLGELFGVTRQVAGDMTGVLYQSMISAQYPGREEFFKKLASSKELPSSTELERMWFELQREMTESGQVAVMHLPIVELDGSRKDADVVRIGPFIAMSDGRYLNYIPEEKVFAVLSRQPPGEFTKAARNLQDAKSGSVIAAVDPRARGPVEPLCRAPTIFGSGSRKVKQLAMSSLRSVSSAPFARLTSSSSCCRRDLRSGSNLSISTSRLLIIRSEGCCWLSREIRWKAKPMPKSPS